MSDQPWADRYDIESILGRGGTGLVYKARQRSLRRVVALKTLLPEVESDPELMSRFRREARLIRDLRHPNVIEVIDVDFEVHPPYMVLEFVEGCRSLFEVIPDGSRGTADRTRILDQVLAGLAHLHAQPMVHRDLKPANILLGPDGVPKIIDFGFSRRVSDDETRLTRAGQVFGTVSYMAPEQIMGEDVTPAADVYAFALIALEVLAGRLIFSADAVGGISAPRRIAGVPVRVEDWIPEGLEPWARLLSRCLEADPDHRPKDGSRCLEALEASRKPPGDVTERVSVSLAPPSGEQEAPVHGSDRTRRSKRAAVTRRGRLPVLGLVLLICLLGMGLVLHWTGSGEESSQLAVDAESQQRVERARRVYAALENLDPAVIGRKLDVPLAARHDGEKIQKIWREGLPDLFLAEEYREAFRGWVNSGLDPETFGVVLERLSALQSIWHVASGIGVDLVPEPEGLLPKKFREYQSFEYQYLPGFDQSGQVGESHLALLTVRINGIPGESSAILTTVKDIAVLEYTIRIGEDGAPRRYNVENGRDESPEFTKDIWSLEIPLDPPEIIQSELALVMLVSPDLSPCSVRISINENSRFYFSKPVRADFFHDARGDELKNHRLVPARWFTRGLNKMTLEVDHAPGIDLCGHSFLSWLFIRIPADSAGFLRRAGPKIRTKPFGSSIEKSVGY